jgi:hypothetical protein
VMNVSYEFHTTRSATNSGISRHAMRLHDYASGHDAAPSNRNEDSKRAKLDTYNARTLIEPSDGNHHLGVVGFPWPRQRASKTPLTTPPVSTAIPPT